MSLLAKARQKSVEASSYPGVNNADLGELAELVEAWARGEVSSQDLASVLSEGKEEGRAHSSSIVAAAVKRLVCHGYAFTPPGTDHP